MPLSQKALEQKDDNLRAINHLLYKAKKDGPVELKHQPPIQIVPSIYVTIYIEVGDPIEWHRKGYIIDINSNTFKPHAARYFIAEGKDTYTEVELSPKQFRDLIEYYKIKELDLFDMYNKKLKE
jgi:hypothetical protein